MTAGKLWMWIGCLLLGTACNPPIPSENKPEFPATDQYRGETPAEAYENMLRRRVNRDGVVHYAGILANDKALRQYVRFLEKRTEVMANAPRRARIAEGINLYNALVIRLVVSHYPISSILDIGMPDGIFPSSDYNLLFPLHPDSPFERKVGKFGTDSISLNALRDTIFADALGDPRVIFAMVDGSTSAPRLKRSLLHADQLEEQLNQATEDFITSPVKNILNPNSPRLSAVFQRDYERFGGTDEALIDFVNQFIPVRIQPGAVVSYGTYDWKLNGY